MVVRKVYVFETRGGRVLAEVEPSETTWSLAGNDPETVDCTIDMTGAVEAARGWRNLGSPWNHCLAVDIGGRLLGGPIMPHAFEGDQGTLKLTARGIRVALARRTVMPVAALSRPLVDPNTGRPDPALNTVFGGLDLGTIGARVIRQALTWPSWDEVPISFPEEVAGTSVAAYAAVDLTRVGDALDDISERENGPDIRLDMRWLDSDHIGWAYISGTEARPRLEGVDRFTWEMGSGSGLKITTNPSRMASVSWAVAGGSDDRVLAEMKYDPRVVDAGGLLLEQEAGVSSNESNPAVLRSANQELLRTADRPWEFWTFSVPADRSPYPSEYSPGDLAEVVVTPATKVAGGYLPPGRYLRRLAGISGGSSKSTVELTFGEAYDG